MKRILNKLERYEKGQALLIVLILLVIGGLIIGPLLGFMSTGLIVGQVYEERMDELYAADAGVEDALWQIITKADGLPQAEDQTMGYFIDPVNGKVFIDLNPLEDPHPIVITYIDEITYKITSTATSTDTGSSTTIESYINIFDFLLFTDNAITSRNDVTLQPGTEITGNIQYNGDLYVPNNPDQYDIDGTTYDDLIIGWPEADVLSGFYWDQVEDKEHYIDDTINVTDTPSFGPLYSLGESLTITNQKGVAGLVGRLDGTVYVTGDLEFEQSGGKTYEIYLDGQTIFALGEIRFPSAGAGEPKCTISGSGCIIAIGDIDFYPSMSSVPDDFIFVMSVEGTVNFQPSGDFYGSLAGDTTVDLKPNCGLVRTDPPPYLNLPGMGDTNVISSILTWEIILQ